MSADDTPVPAAPPAPVAPEEPALPPLDPDFVPSVFDYFETDPTSEEAGKWFNDIRPGLNIKMRRLASKAAMAVRERAQLRYRKAARNWQGEFSQEDNRKILLEVMAYSVITDWGGKAMRDKDEQPIPFSAESAFRLLGKMPHLFEELLRISYTIDSFRVEDQKALEGNS